MSVYDLADEEVTVAAASPTSPEAAALVAALDRYLLSLYAAEHTHLLSPRVLAQPNTVFCLARLDGTAVGCGAARFCSGYVEVKRMYVVPAWRGRGIARVVLKWLEDQALYTGYATVRLETGVNNTAAVRLYETSGYVRIPPFGEYTDNGVSLCYEKRIA
jgi:putative acetyltransferase